MIAELTTIKTAYEEEGMSPEQIAEDRGLDIVATKAALMQSSFKYRKDCGHESEEKDELNFSDDELKRVNQVILDLALGAEDDHLRFKAATYVRDDKKGRKEIVKAIKDNGTNITIFNQKILQVREAAARLTSSINQPQLRSINGA